MRSRGRERGEGRGMLTPLLKLPRARQTRKFAEKRGRAMRDPAQSGRPVMLGEAIVNTCLVSLISARAFRLAVNYIVDASRNNGGYIGRKTNEMRRGGASLCRNVSSGLPLAGSELGVFRFALRFHAVMIAKSKRRGSNARNRKRNLEKSLYASNATRVVVFKIANAY